MKIKTKINTTIKNIKLMKFLKKTLNYSFFSFILFFFLPNSSFAAVAVDSSALWEILSWLVASIWAILWLLTWLISLFLNPGWTSWSIFWLTWYLKEMWILVSNVVYFIFAWILIVIAFMNIVWKWTDKFELKQSLPKFIVWILIVPFSWFLVQFILSISAILTVSVLTIPYDTFAPTFDKVSDKAIEWLCKKMVFHIQWATWALSTTKWAWATKNSDSFWKTFECVEGSGKVTFKDIVSWKNGNSQNLYWIISIYTFWIMELWELDKISISQLSGIESIMKLSAKTIFDLAFIIVYLILMVALFLALFTRWMWLWMYAMMSPLFWLMYFLWDKWWETLKKFNFKEFFALAMVPVLVSAALSFWLLFIFVAGQWLSTNSVDGNSSWDKIYSKDWLNLWFMTLQFEWESWNTKDAGSFISALFNWTMNTVWWLMIKTFWLALLWVAVLAALNYSSIIKTVIEPIDKFWKSVWSLAMSAPKYMPIPGTNWLSANTLQQFWTWLNDSIVQSSNRKTQQWFKDHNLFQDTAWLREWINKFGSELSTATTNLQRANAVKNVLLTQDPLMLAENSEFINQLKTIDVYKGITKDLKVNDRDAFAKVMVGINKFNEESNELGLNNVDMLWDYVKNSANYTMQDLIKYIKEKTNRNSSWSTSWNSSWNSSSIQNIELKFSNDTNSWKSKNWIDEALVDKIYSQILQVWSSIDENALKLSLRANWLSDDSETKDLIKKLKDKYEKDITINSWKLKWEDFIKKDAPKS